MNKLLPWPALILAAMTLLIFTGSISLGPKPDQQRPEPLMGVCQAPDSAISSIYDQFPVLRLAQGLIQHSEKQLEAQLPDITGMLPYVPLDRGSSFEKMIVHASPYFI